MSWLFLSIVVVCITVVAWKFIDEGCDVDIWGLSNSIDRIEKSIREIEKLLKEGGRDD